MNDLLSKFGSTASYPTIVRLETAMALKQRSQSVPAEFEDGQWTAVVWDNIDFNNETLTGGGSVHYVNGIMLQQKSINDSPQTQQEVPSINKATRTMPLYDKNIVPVLRLPKQGPADTAQSVPQLDFNPTSIDDFLYIAIRYAHHSPECLPL